MATITKQGVAAFDSYSETVSPQGELVITAIYQGIGLQQTVIVNNPGILYFDPPSLNFFFLINLDDLQPTYLFVETITSVAV